MAKSYESSGSQETRSAVMQLCDNHFGVARQKDLTDNGSIYTGIFTDKHKNTYEFVVLLDYAGEKNLAYLYKQLEDNADADKFPYILVTDSFGIDQQSDKPELIRETFHVDPEGKFHSLRQIDHRTVDVIPEYARSGLLEILGSSDVCEIPAFYE